MKAALRRSIDASSGSSVSTTQRARVAAQKGSRFILTERLWWPMLSKVCEASLRGFAHDLAIQQQGRVPCHKGEQQSCHDRFYMLFTCSDT